MDAARTSIAGRVSLCVERFVFWRTECAKKITVQPGARIRSLGVLAVRRVLDAAVVSFNDERYAFRRGARAVFGLVQVELPGAEIAVCCLGDHGKS